MSCVTFIAQLLTEPCQYCPWTWVLMTDCRPWKEWECCIQWRWRCLHNILSVTLNGLFCSLSLFTLGLLFFPLPPFCILYLAACPPPPTPFHVFVLKFSVFPRFSVKVLSFAQISRSLPFPSSTFCCYLYRHLLTNISLFLILPTTLHGTCLILLVPTLWCHSSLAPSPSPSSFPGSLCPGSLTIVGAYTTKQLSPAHRGVCECVFARVCVFMCICMLGNNRKRMRICEHACQCVRFSVYIEVYSSCVD